MNPQINSELSPQLGRERQLPATPVNASLPRYEPPSVFSFSDRDILDQLGPAQTYNSGLPTTWGG
jgi:hypothetical protein